MAHLINITSKTKSGKTVSKNIPYVNPNATDSDIKSFVKAFTGLSEDTVQAAQKIVKSEIENNPPPVTIQGTDGADSLYSNYKRAVIDAGAGSDVVSLDGAKNNEVSLGTGQDTVYAYNGAANNTIYSGAPNSGDATTWNAATLDGANNNLLHEYFLDVYIYGGAGNAVETVGRCYLADGAANNTIYGGKVSLNGANSNAINQATKIYIYNDAVNNSVSGVNIYSSVEGGNVFILPSVSANFTGYSTNDTIIIPEGVTVTKGLYDSLGNYTVSLSSGKVASLKTYSGELQIFDAEGERVSVGVAVGDDYFTPTLNVNSTNKTQRSLVPNCYFINTASNVTVYSSPPNTVVSNAGNSCLITCSKDCKVSLTGNGTNNSVSAGERNYIYINGSPSVSVYGSGSYSTLNNAKGTGSLSMGGAAKYWSIYSNAARFGVYDAQYCSITYGANATGQILQAQHCLINHNSTVSGGVTGTECTVTSSAPKGLINVQKSYVTLTGASMTGGLGNNDYNFIVSKGNYCSVRGNYLNATLDGRYQTAVKTNVQQMTLCGFDGDDSLRLSNGTYHHSLVSGNDIYIYSAASSVATATNGYWLLKDAVDENNRHCQINVAGIITIPAGSV